MHTPSHFPASSCFRYPQKALWSVSLIKETSVRQNYPKTSSCSKEKVPLPGVPTLFNTWFSSCGWLWRSNPCAGVGNAGEGPFLRMLYQTGSFRMCIKNTSNKTIIMIPLLIPCKQHQWPGLRICVSAASKLNKSPYPNRTPEKPYKIII